jgi:hypothetical protein
LLAAIAVLSMPLLVLQARLLTSELGTAAGAALIVYALVALARPYRDRGARGAVLDALGATAALAAGVGLGFLGGGALLGLAVPLGAFAAASALGVPFVRAAVRRRPVLPELPALVATLAAAAVLGLLAWQIYDVKDPHPGIVPQARQIFGQAIVPEGCWSWALGGVWRPEDDLRFIFDSTFEQIAYGTFPWGVLAPLAMAALLRDPEPDRRFAGALALAWAGAAWIATEAFQRKVGGAIWAGFPALAIAVAVWFDALLARGDAAPAPAPAPTPGPAGPTTATALLVGLFFVLATVNLGDIVAELDNAIGLARHGALRLLAKAGGPDPGPAEMRADLSPLIDAYAERWLARSRPGGLPDSVVHLHRTLDSYDER